jgi:hypothetical protein
MSSSQAGCFLSRNIEQKFCESYYGFIVLEVTELWSRVSPKEPCIKIKSKLIIFQKIEDRHVTKVLQRLCEAFFCVI